MKYLYDFLKKYGLSKVKYKKHVLKGEASELIPELAEKSILTS